MFKIIKQCVSYLARTQGLFGWKDKPFTRADLVSNFVNIVELQAYSLISYVSADKTYF